MGWSGDFLIRYNGDSAEDFLKLAKMLIPNSIMRFDFNDYSKTVNSIELQCTRNLSWYSADEDMKRLLSYLPDEDTISMEIDGECDYEHVRICKINGKVILENSNEESERYRSNDIGIPEMLYEEHSPRYVQGEGERINVCTIDGYIQLIADTFAGDEKLIPIVQEFMYEVLDKEKINSFSWDKEDQLSEEDCTKLEQLRSKFETVDSARQFLEEQKQSDSSFELKKRQSAVSLPDCYKDGEDVQMDNILYALCRHCVSIMDGWHPYPATCIAQNLNMSVHKVRYHLRKLKIEGLVESFRENGLTEDGEVFCLWGWRITDKTINTLEYKKAFEEERKLCKKYFDVDIGEE